jgi:SAM-dependent methyltransferase
MNKYLARPYHLFRRRKYFSGYLSGCATRGEAPRLHVGCGNRPIAGWCNIDVAHLNEHVQYADALNPMPFEPGTFRYVFSEHFIEHLTFADGVRFFREAARVLSPGGVLRTATPDFDFLCGLRELDTDAKRRYARYVHDSFAPEQPVSGAACANLAFRGWGHRYIWSPSVMEEVLKPLGFGDFRRLKPGQSDHAELIGIEQHGKSVPPDINEMETFVLEAVRR